MKDNWTKAFQEKLGDYQLEMPAAAPRRRGPGRLVLLLSGAAAAAALAAVLLLRMPEDGQQEQGLPEGLIAEVPATVFETQPEMPAAIRPMRSLAAGNPQTQEPIVTTEPVQPEEPEPPITRQEKPDEPAKADVSETEETVIDWNEEEPARRQAGISARLHVNPFVLQVVPNEKLPNPSSMSELHLRGGISTYNNMGDYAYNLNKNSNWSSSIGTSEDQARCDMPIKTGLSVRIGGAGRLSLESGLDYSFHRATAAAYYGLVPTSYQMEYRMHYLGIPVKGIFSIAEWQRLSLYAAAGGEVEWMAFGRIRIRGNGQRLVDDRIQEHPFLFSLTGAGGLEFNFTPKLGLYAEPGIAWHATPKGNLPNYYRDHPLSFDLHLGLRFNL